MMGLLRSLVFALAYSAALLTWLQWFFLHPLAEEAAAMHESQLDPTEIIEIPYDVKRLALFVTVVFVAIVTITMIATTRRQLSSLRLWVKSSVALFVLCIVAGASPYRDILHTLLTAMYMSTLCWFAPPIFEPDDDGITMANDSSDLLEHVRDRVSTSGGKTSQQSVLAATTLQATMGCTIPFPILLLYDRGWQVQRWPVPLILGSTIGWSLGVVLGTALAFRRGFLDGLSKKEEASSSPVDR